MGLYLALKITGEGTARALEKSDSEKLHTAISAELDIPYSGTELENS